VFWGYALIALGAVWLAGNLFGLDDWGRWLVPILLSPGAPGFWSKEHPVSTAEDLIRPGATLRRNQRVAR